MTVYTVIGHITNAILTFESLQIPSNLSGGPQLLNFLASQKRNPRVQRKRTKEKKRENVACSSETKHV